MIFEETPLSGSYLIHLEKMGDERGFFARLFCSEQFKEKGLESRFVQVNNSLSAETGTLRGMHYQVAPHEEVKLVRCVRGSLYDAIVDMRPDSPTYGRSFGATLSAENRSMMYVPRGFAHGFLTLEPDTEAIYLVSTPYAPASERGAKWDDPAFAIAWPAEPKIISEKDMNHPKWDGSTR